MSDTGDEHAANPPDRRSADSIQLDIALALARASVRALMALSPESGAQVRAYLRREAVALDMRLGPDAQAAAAALRQMLDDGG